MQRRAASIIKILSWLAVAGIVVMLGLLVDHLVFGGGASSAPRTEAERAVFAATEAVEANPEDPAARVKLASAYLEQGAVDAALKQARLAVQMDPADPTAYYVLGLAYERAGDGEAAMENLERATTTEGQLAAFYQDANVALARVYLADGRTEDAFTAMDQAIDLGPENAVLLHQRGLMYEEIGEYADALLDYTLALRYVPDYEPALEAYRRVSSEHPEAVDEMRERFDLETILGSEAATTTGHGAVEQD